MTISTEAKVASTPPNQDSGCPGSLSQLPGRLFMETLNLKKVFEMAHELSKQREELTAEQFFDAILQSLQCGDFMTHITIERQQPVGEFDPCNPKTYRAVTCQMVTYEPFRREQELKSKLKQAELERDELYAIAKKYLNTPELTEWAKRTGKV